MTLTEMAKKMTEKEFLMWIEYDSYEPLNSADLQVALLTSVTANAAGSKAAPSDFLISRKPEVQEPLTGKALETYLEGLF